MNGHRIILLVGALCVGASMQAADAAASKCPFVCVVDSVTHPFYSFVKANPRLGHILIIAASVYGAKYVYDTYVKKDVKEMRQPRVKPGTQS